MALRRFPRRISINLYDADEKQEYDRHKLKHDKTYFGIPTELNFDDWQLFLIHNFLPTAPLFW